MTSPLPAIPDKASALRERLMDELRTGQRPPGTRLPSEADLARQCRVSRTTVRAALAELTQAGLVVREQGRGTFVHADADRRLSVPAAAIVLRVAVVLPCERMRNPIFQAILARFLARLEARIRPQIYHHDFIKPAVYAAQGAGLVIVDGGYGADAIAALRAQCAQLVVLNRLHRDLPVACTDNRAGGEMMAAHVLARGHRRIGIIHFGSQGTEEEFMLRLRGIRQVLKAAGVEPVEEGLQLHNQRAFTPHQAVERLLRRAPDLSALLCITDSLALQVLEACEEQGVAVPGRLSLMGFDGLSACRYTMPALTTVQQPVDDLGDALCEAAAACCAGKAIHLERALRPQLAIRASVADLNRGSTS